MKKILRSLANALIKELLTIYTLELISKIQEQSELTDRTKGLLYQLIEQFKIDDFLKRH